jgi:hypothetical protein
MDRSPSRPRHRSRSEDRVGRLEFGYREPPTACRGVVLQKGPVTRMHASTNCSVAHTWCANASASKDVFVRSPYPTVSHAQRRPPNLLPESETRAALTLRRLRPTSASVRDAASAAMAACLSGPTR